MQSGMRVNLVLAVGVFAVGWAAILIRLAEAPALATAAYRLTIAGVPVAVLTLARQRSVMVTLPVRSRWLLVASGLALALHFGAWIASLQLTSVASSVALVTTQPLWALLIGATLLRERITRAAALAITLATLGGVVIGARDIAAGDDALLGDALALVGAIAAAIYLSLGRVARGELSLLPYVGVVYPVAAGALLVAAVVAGSPLRGFSGQTWLMFVLLALVPQLVGHTSLNWALRYLPAHMVGVAILGEPVIAVVLAIPILGEWPGVWRTVGGAITLVGVYLALRGGMPSPPVPAVISERARHP